MSSESSFEKIITSMEEAKKKLHKLEGVFPNRHIPEIKAVRKFFCKGCSLKSMGKCTDCIGVKIAEAEIAIEVING